MSRAELAKATGLTRPAITVIVEDLLSQDLIQELTVNGVKPQKSVKLAINSMRLFAVGISLTREKCNVGVVNLAGEVICENPIALPNESSIDECIAHICQQVISLVNEANIDQKRVLGCGISAPGPVDTSNGTFLRPGSFEKWHNVPIVSMMEKQLPWRCTIENAALALTMAEKIYGAGRKYHSFVLLKVTSGVGGGIVINDSILRGGGNYGNEIGHMIIQIDGEPCDCGSRGCLAAYASMRALKIKFGDAGFQNWSQLVDSAYAGNSQAMSIMQTEALYLSSAITSYVNMLEPETIILAGAITYRPKLLLALIREQVNASTLMRDVRHVDIICSDFNDADNVEIAATIFIEGFFQGDFQLQN